MTTITITLATANEYARDIMGATNIADAIRQLPAPLELEANMAMDSARDAASSVAHLSGRLTLQLSDLTDGRSVAIGSITSLASRIEAARAEHTTALSRLRTILITASIYMQR